MSRLNSLEIDMHTYASEADMAALNPDEKKKYVDFLNRDISFVIFESKVGRKPVWVVAPEDNADFWMGCWGTEEGAISFCSKLGIQNA